MVREKLRLFSDPSRLVGRFRETRARYGTATAMKTIVAWLCKRLALFDLSKITWLDAQNRPVREARIGGVTSRPLTAEEVGLFARDPEYQLDPALAQRVSEGHDLCVGAFLGPRLIAFGWYGLNCLEGEHNLGVPVSAPSNIAHEYNAFTHPDFRGKGVRGPMLETAIEALAPHGVRYLVSVIEWANWASLRSSQSRGDIVLGQIFTLCWGAKRWPFPPKAARDVGLRYGREADLKARSGAATATSARSENGPADGNAKRALASSDR